MLPFSGAGGQQGKEAFQLWDGPAPQPLLPDPHFLGVSRVNPLRHRITSLSPDRQGRGRTSVGIYCNKSSGAQVDVVTTAHAEESDGTEERRRTGEGRGRGCDEAGDGVIH